MRRRVFLRLFAGGAVAVGCGGLYLVFRKPPTGAGPAAQPQPPQPPAAPRLFTPDEAAWLAALVPVPVAPAVLESRLDPERLEFYRAALAHLTRLRPGFLHDEPAAQARFVTDRLATDDLVFQFITQVSYDAAEVYYATPAGRAAVGYPGPPQPHGFPGFAGPP